MLLSETHPARTAAREHRARLFRLYPFDEFVGLFHDGKVGGKIGVVYAVEAERAQRGNHAALRCLFSRHAHALAPCRTNGRRNLNHSYYLRVGQSRKHLGRVIACGKRTRGAMRNALATQSAIRAGNVGAAGDAHATMRSGTRYLPHSALLYLRAFGNAAHAANALGGVALQRERFVPRLELVVGVALQIGRVAAVRHDLQRAGAAALARGAFAAVGRQNGFHIRATRRNYARRARARRHAVENARVARGGQGVFAFNLHHAYAA